MAINRPFTLFSLQNLAYAKLRNLVISGIKTNDAVPDDLFAISTDATVNQQAEASDIIHKVLLDILLHAVVDNDRKTVQTILNTYPELLLINPPTNFVTESRLTWHKFYAEGALNMAVKRKQIKMIELILPYYDKLKQTEEVKQARAECLAAWKAYEIKKNDFGEDEILIPKEYADYAQSLIDVFQDETFPNGVPGVNGVPLNVILSRRTELALSSLLNILVPKTAVKLDEHIDEELLLLAIHKAYEKNYQAFNYKWNKLDTLCIRLMGLTQSALIPETGDIYCEGLDDVVRGMIDNGKEKEISPRAASHTLKGGQPFYRVSREARSGSGFDFLTGRYGGSFAFATYSSWHDIWCSRAHLDSLCRAKATNFRNITQQLQQQPHQDLAGRKQPGCVIL